MFSRLGAWCARRRGTVVIAWILVLVIGGGLSGAIGSNFSTEFGLPDVESKRGFDILEEQFDSDPEGARRTVSEARAATSAAIADLRSVVRGIHPPVLADRGLGGWRRDDCVPRGRCQAAHAVHVDRSYGPPRAPGEYSRWRVAHAIARARADRGAAARRR